jgi:hypothetical protein
VDIVRTYGLKFGSVACIDASRPPQAVSRQGQSKKCPDFVKSTFMVFFSSSHRETPRDFFLLLFEKNKAGR